MNYKRTWWLRLLPLSIICFSPVAGAESPIKQDPVELPFENAFVVSCTPFGYDFDILYTGSFTFQSTHFFDKEGNLARIRERIHVNGGVYINSVDSTKIIDLDPGWGANSWLDWKTGEYVQTGAYTRVTVPGYGAVALGVGRLSINPDGVLTYNGKANFIEGDLAMLCSVLA